MAVFFVAFSAWAGVLAAKVNDATGYWHCGRKALKRIGRRLDVFLSDKSPGEAAEVERLLVRSGLFASRLMIAQREDSVTLVSDGRHRLELSLGGHVSRRRCRAYIHDGFLVVEQLGEHVVVRSTFARIDGAPMLCRAVKLSVPHDRSAAACVIKQVLVPADNEARLPRPWKEPPSILPPPSRRRASFLEKGVQGLVNVGKLALPFF